MSNIFHLHVSQEALAAKTLANHEAEDSRGLWESEVKARSKLGLRVSSHFHMVGLRLPIAKSLWTLE